MTDDPSDIEVQFVIWQNDDGRFFCDPQDIPVVDRAMRVWAESRRDSWVGIHSPEGIEFSVLASTINSTTLSTSQQRYDTTLREKALEDERLEHRRLAGFIESE